MAINDVIQRAFEIFSQQLKVRGIDVRWDLAPGLPPIKADPSCLEQVFIMLQRAPTMDLLYAGKGDEIGGGGDTGEARSSP